MVLSLQLSSIEFRLKMSHISRYWGMSLWVRSFTAPRRLFFLQMKCFGDHWVAVIFYRLRLVLWVLFGALGMTVAPGFTQGAGEEPLSKGPIQVKGIFTPCTIRNTSIFMKTS